MAKGSPRRQFLPLSPLLLQFRASHPHAPPPVGIDTLDGPDAALADRLRLIARAAAPIAFHDSVFASRLRVVRFALGHLFRGHDALPERLARCVTPGEAYHVPGLGPGFWAAVVRSVEPGRIPLWCPAVERGLARLKLFPEGAPSPAERFAAVVAS